MATNPDKQTVFVVHGRNSKARDSMFIFLRSIGLKPLEWSQDVKRTGKATPYIGEILDAAFSEAQTAIILMTPDDEARLRLPFQTETDPLHEIELTPQARPNVLFEAGIAMAWFKEKTIFVEIGQLRPFTDIAGRHVIRLDNSTQKRQELIQRLEIAGCSIDRDGTDWHKAGDFTLDENLSANEKSEKLAEIREVLERIISIKEFWSCGEIDLGFFDNRLAVSTEASELNQMKYLTSLGWDEPQPNDNYIIGIIDSPKFSKSWRTPIDSKILLEIAEELFQVNYKVHDLSSDEMLLFKML